MNRGREIVVALHAGSLAGDRGHRDALARTQVSAAEAGARHQHHAADAGGRRSPTGFADALHGKTRRFCHARAALKFLDRRRGGIEQIEVRELFCQQRRIGEARILVLGRDARHGDGALGQARNVGRNVVGRNHGLFAPDQDAQADIVAFGPFGLLDIAVTDFDALRHAAHGDRIGGIRARALRRLDQTLRQIDQCRLIKQTGGFLR